MYRREVCLLALSQLSHIVPIHATTISADTPIITDVTLDVTELENEYLELTLTITAESKSPVDWLRRRFESPIDTILGGGSGTSFEEIEDGLWEHSRTYTLSKWTPDGTYAFEDIQVRNEAREESETWSDPVETVIDTKYMADEPEIIDVSLDKNRLTDDDTELEFTVTAESNAPVNWLRRRFEGPTDTILGGGGGRHFEEVEDEIWRYSHSHTLSKWAPDGEYAFEDIRVRNEGRLDSAIWSETVKTHVETDFEAEKPEIQEASFEISDRDNGETELEFSITATSNAPVNWLRRRFEGPTETILGGGGGTTFEEIEPGLWSHTRSHTISKHAPAGEYAYREVVVRNEGRRESAVWSGDLSVVITEAPPALPGHRETPTDPHNDGRYRDVTGDGQFDLADVRAFFTHYKSEAVQEHRLAFDFARDGAVGFADVEALLADLNSWTNHDLSTAAIFSNDDGQVDTKGLRAAVDRWRSGDIETETLRDVVDAWRSGEPVL